MLNVDKRLRRDERAGKRAAVVPRDSSPRFAPIPELEGEPRPARPAAGEAAPRAVKTALKRRAKALAMWASQRAPLSRVLSFRGPASARQVALTFDDGPHPDFTLPVLDVLARRGARATFFVLGRQVERHPELLCAIRDAGHEIGIHGYDHTSRDLARQVRRTRDILRRHGVTAQLVRPPRGELAARDGIRIALGGYRTILWSFDARDSMRAEGKYRGRISYAELAGGDIVLLHDDNAVCLSELDGIISTVRERGLGVGPISAFRRPA